MNLSVIFVVVMLWGFYTRVKAKFYLETKQLLVQSDYVYGQYDGDENQFTWFLYQCENIQHEQGGNWAVRCNEVKPSNQAKVYNLANFNSVTNLRLAVGHTIEIEGKTYITEELSHVLAVGVEPRNYQRPSFRPFPEDWEFVDERIIQDSARFIDSIDHGAMTRLRGFLALNNIAFFTAWHADSPEMFTSFTAVLKSVLDASGYNPKTGCIEILLAESKPFLGAMHRIPTKILSKTLSKAQTQSKSLSKSISKTISDSLPQGLFRRLSRCMYLTRSNSQSQSQLKPRSPSPTESPSSPRSKTSRRRSSPSGQSPSPSPPSLASSPSSPSSPRSPSSSPSESSELSSAFLLKKQLVMTIGHFSLKMFDPCLVLNLGVEEIALANSICSIYCNFLSMTIEVYQYVYHESCKFLQEGRCVDKMCVCSTNMGPIKRNVNMVFCNNAFRLKIYEQGKYRAFWPANTH